jgi:NTE family protein
MTTAFVLAGGGSLGAVEVGMLGALTAQGEHADFIVGASAGAINGTYFAAEPTAAGVAKLERLWRSLKREDVLPFSFKSLIGLMSRREYVVDSGGLRRLLERHLSYRRIEEAAVPVYVVAADMLVGSEVLLSHGPVVDAVLASTAIPGVFPPVHIDGRDLVDGGVANNTPISTAMRLGADRIIVLPTGFACALKQPPRTAVGRALHALSLMVARQLTSDIERYANEVALHVVPPLCPVDTHGYDYSACGGLIDRAAQQTREWIADGGLTTPNGVPHQLVEHTH